MLVDMLKGFLVGICASVPIGPIAILVVQKSLSMGHKAGFVSGLGASVVDTFYASIAIFALAFAQRFHGHGSCSETPLPEASDRSSGMSSPAR